MTDEQRKLARAQLEALRWMRDFPSTRAEWQVDGKPIRRGQGPDKWNTMRLEGARGSVVIAVADWRALHGFIEGRPAPGSDKVYGPSEAGLRALAEAEAAHA